MESNNHDHILPEDITAPDSNQSGQVIPEEGPVSDKTFANDFTVAFNLIAQALAESFSGLGLDLNQTLQIGLCISLCSLILFTCLYRRQKIAKSAMITI